MKIITNNKQVQLIFLVSAIIWTVLFILGIGGEVWRSSINLLTAIICWGGFLFTKLKEKQMNNSAPNDTGKS